VYPLVGFFGAVTMVHRPVLLTVCLLASTNQAGRADDYNVKREIAWARSVWQADLKNVQFQSPTTRLLDWAPPGGSVKVWLLSENYRCTEIELHRVALATPTSAGDTEVLIGKHFVADANLGATSRTYTVVSLGFLFAETDDYCREDIASGTPLGCGGMGREGQSLGALSDIDGESARFAGEPISLDPECAGPVKWLKCESGGKRPCVACQKVALNPIEMDDSSYGDYRGGWITDSDRRRATCSEACPDPSPGPTLTRIEELERRTHVWRPRTVPAAEVPTVHRTLAGCMGAHSPKEASPAATPPRPSHKAD
jgi:hypothetical protein